MASVATDGMAGLGDASGDRVSLGVSVLLHCSLFAALTFSIGQTPKRPPPFNTESIDISAIPGDGKDAMIPKIAAPSSDERDVVDPQTRPDPRPVADVAEAVEEVRPEVRRASSGETIGADPSLEAGSPDSGGTIWTPPAPRPNDADSGMAYSPETRDRVVLPQVQIGHGASDAVLLSYDQVRFSDTASISESLRLAGVGRITMSASIDEKGLVTSCVVSITSGSQLLDERACALVSSYRYRPAQDSKGAPHASIVSEVLEWGKAELLDAPGAVASGAPARQRVLKEPGSAPVVSTRMPTVSMPPRR